MILLLQGVFVLLIFSSLIHLEISFRAFGFCNTVTKWEL